MNRIFFVLLFLAFSYKTEAQFNTKYSEATIFFKDGTNEKGLAKITAYGDKIKYKKDKASKKVTYTSKELVSIKILKKTNVHLFNTRGDLQLVHYFYKKVKNYKNNRLLELLESGKVNLYRDLKEGQNFNHHANGHVSMTSYSISSYYVSKEDEEETTHLGDKGLIFSKNFKKAAANYFKDCPKLVDKINNKEYRKKDIIDVVKYYNNNCN